MKKLGLISFYGAALLCMALFVNSCSKDDISVNINWTEEYPQNDTSKYPWQSPESAQQNCWLLRIGVARVAGLNPTSHAKR